MKPDISRYAPPGLNLAPERNFFLTGLVCALLYSLGFFGRLTRAVNALYETRRGVRVLLEGAVMEDFAAVLGGALAGFLVLALCMLAFLIYHYTYHRQGSRSIYLMRRLPSRWELHRRCLTLPVLAALLCLLAAFLLLVIYYAIYRSATPEACLSGGQWRKLWRGIR